MERQRVLDTVMATATSIELVYVMDCTPSMEKWLATAARDCVEQVASVHSTFGATGDVRVAFVGYRDYGDEVLLLDFTNVKRFKEFVLKVDTASVNNNDYCEDVFTGIEYAARLSWRPKDEGNAKHIFHIGDAPCHGLQYHDLGEENDNYPDGESVAYAAGR